jgi:hypothetical protein
MTENGAFTKLQGPAWRLLAEFPPLGEPGDEQRLAERVARAVHELDLPPAQMRRIEQAVQGAASKATHRIDQDQHHSAISVRVWVSGVPTEGPTGSRPEPLRVSQHRRSGWGFFLIEKGEGDPNAPDPESLPTIELFLYQERTRSR